MTSRSSRLRLHPPVRDALRDRAADGRPAEVCGVLVGHRSDRADEPDEVRDAHPVPNVAADPRTRYELDPERTLAAVERAEDVVGFYHSHPRGPPEPSATDRERATWPGYVYCIVVPGDGAEPDGEVRAWRWTGEAFEPLAVEAGGG